jgi:putative secretion ATPase (PEP-CTERM system associated)
MYERFYGLIAKPFRLTPDAHFLFQSTGHAKALAYLRYGLQCREGFVVITGDVGAGKTTLVQALLTNLNSENVVAAQLVSTQLESEETLPMVAASFGLASQGLTKSDLLRNFNTFLTARAREGKRVLLVVDEVQNLPVASIEELRMLSNYQSGDRALLQTFFLGQSEFLATMQLDEMEQFRQRIVAAHHLGPLAPDETSDYIKYRLQLAGWQDDPHFTDEAFAAIHAYTDGIPRRINAVCDRVLVSGCLEEIHEITEATIAAIGEEERRERDAVTASVDSGVAALAEDEADDAASAQPARMVSDTERRLRALEKRMDVMERHCKRLQDLVLPILNNEDVDQSGQADQPRKADTL